MVFPTQLLYRRLLIFSLLLNTAPPPNFPQLDTPPHYHSFINMESRSKLSTCATPPPNITSAPLLPPRKPTSNNRTPSTPPPSVSLKSKPSRKQCEQRRQYLSEYFDYKSPKEWEYNAFARHCRANESFAWTDQAVRQHWVDGLNRLKKRRGEKQRSL